ncbi:DUF4397 domain-containing protein [Halobellus salinisoli]|uniref:DUF4397 domain-containing protein n=1 Tax=Halobellus salinisoli TaxID=3108500 RepID=UPI0030092898
MVHTHLSRRQFVGTVTAVTTVGLAGCGGDGTGNGGEDDSGGTEETNGSPTTTETDAPTETEATTEAEETTTEGGDGDALVRVVHAAPDAPNVDVYVDDEAALSDVAFRSVSEYLSLAAGSYQVQITAAGDQETVVFDDEVEVSEGSATSLVALGELEAETFEVQAFEDDVSAAGAEESRVRALHASPDAPAVDVAVEGEEEPLISELAFGEASDYATVPSGAYTLEVRAAGESEAVASFDVELASMTGYTAFAMGYLNPDEAAADEPFDLTLATDTVESEATATANGTEMTEETTAATTE